MAMQFDLVTADVDVLPDRLTDAAGGRAPLPANPAALRALLHPVLRPLVLEIVADEIERLNRRYGA